MIDMVKLVDKVFKISIMNKICMFKRVKESMNMTNRGKDYIKKI